MSELYMCNKLVLLFLQERLLTLKKQAVQITQQAQREKESFLKERSTLEAMLQRVRRPPCLQFMHVVIRPSVYKRKEKPSNKGSFSF